MDHLLYIESFVQLAFNVIVLAIITYFLATGIWWYQASKMWTILLFGIWIAELANVLVGITKISCWN